MAALINVETSFNYCEKGDDRGFFSSNEQRWITHIKRLAEKYPDKCIILQTPEKNGGFIYAKMPTEWLKISPKREVSEEQRQKAAERFKAMWQERNEEQGE